MRDRQSRVPIFLLFFALVIVFAIIIGVLNNTTQEAWLHFDTVGGASAEHVFCIPAGTTTQDRRFTKLIVCLDDGPGMGKELNILLTNGVDEMWVNLTGTEIHGNTTDGSFDWDASAETLNIDQFHSAGGAVSHINICVQWYWKENE